MADRPILFSGPMVRALLNGSKTQTRRVISDQPGSDDSALGEWHADHDGHGGRVFVPDAGLPRVPIRIPYEVGDRLYVREAWRTAAAYDDLPPRELGGEEPVRFEADREAASWSNTMRENEIGKFRQGMHMPRWASRLTLTVTDVRVERLKDITTLEAISEGVFHCGFWDGRNDNDERIGGSLYEDYSGQKAQGFRCPRDSFRSLWDSLNAARGLGWAENPWVVAYTFTTARGNIDAD